MSVKRAHVSEIQGDFLVLATGRSGAVGRHLGSRVWKDRLCLVGGFVPPAPECGEWLLVEAVSNGWWYSAPFRDGQLFAGWMTDANELRLHESRTIALKVALSEAPLTSARLLSVPSANVRMAGTVALHPCAGADWIAVGDAAISRDPLSGEGLACAMRSGWNGAASIIAAASGIATALTEATARGDEDFKAYLRQRTAAYSAQPRWPDAQFWARRSHEHTDST